MTNKIPLSYSFTWTSGNVHSCIPLASHLLIDTNRAFPMPATRGSATKVTKKTAAEPTPEVKKLVKNLVQEISGHGEGIKKVAAKKAFPASSKVAKKNQVAKAIEKRVVTRAAPEAPSVTKEAKAVINAAILKKTVGNKIKKMVIKLILGSSTYFIGFQGCR